MSQPDKSLLTEFAARMNEICDDKGLTKAHGRQAELGRKFDVTPKAARRWLLGLGLPELVMAIRIAEWADVNLNWLLQGVGPKRGNRIDARLAVLDDAIHSLPRDQGLDLIDNLRAKLIRVGRITAEEPEGRYQNVLQSYERDFQRKRQ